MRLPAEVVVAADPEADSIRVLVVKLSTRDSTEKIWKLSEGELLIPSLPAGSCSLFVELFRRDAAPNGQDPATAAKGGVRFVTHRSSSVITIASGKSVTAAVSLKPIVGSLSLNVSIYGNLDDLAPPLPSPAGGNYTDTQNVALTTRGGVGTIQWRIENAKTGNTRPWQSYTAPIAIEKSAVLYFRTIIGVDTGLIGTANYSINLPVAQPLLVHFNTALTSPPGWNGFVLANPGNTAAGSVVASSLNGTLAARSTHTFLSSVAAPHWVTMRFNIPASNWPNLQVSFLGMSSQPRTVRVTLLSALPEYQALVSAGGGLVATAIVNTATTVVTLPKAMFVPTGSFPASIDLADVYATITGVDISYGCPGPLAAAPASCAEANGNVTIDNLTFGNP